MKNDNYHHGDLKESLIKAGLKLYNLEGAENFSLRKVAAMCNVSHAAPYKHFKNKEELLKAMYERVFTDFGNSLKEISMQCEDDPYERIIQVGKRYVWFMVENPDYLKFAFLRNDGCEIAIENNELNDRGYGSFSIFRNCAEDYLKSISAKKEDYARDIIAMWAMVHGLAVMLSNKTITCNGDYLKLVEDIIRKNLKF